MDDRFATDGTAAISVGELNAVKEKLDLRERRLELCAICYDKWFGWNVDDHFSQCAYVIFWTRRSETLEPLDENFRGFEEITPPRNDRRLGCYLYDYGNCTPMSLDRMKMQCETGLQLLMEGRIVGIVFLALRVVKAAAIASRELDAPVTIHTYTWSDTGTEIVRTMLAVGADPKRIVICHTDVEPDASHMETLFPMGVFVEFDNLGKEFYINKADRGFAGGIFVTELERVRLVARFLDSGDESQVLITDDIWLKWMVHAFGGWGYDHIVTNVCCIPR